MEKEKKIIASNAQPVNKEVLWLDISKSPYILKAFTRKGIWESITKTADVELQELTNIVNILTGGAPEDYDTLKEIAEAIVAQLEKHDTDVSYLETKEDSKAADKALLEEDNKLSKRIDALEDWEEL